MDKSFLQNHNLQNKSQQYINGYVKGINELHHIKINNNNIFKLKTYYNDNTNSLKHQHKSNFSNGYKDGWNSGIIQNIKNDKLHELSLFN